MRLGPRIAPSTNITNRVSGRYSWVGSCLCVSWIENRSRLHTRRQVTVTLSTCLSVWGEPSPGTNICRNGDCGEFVPDGSYPHIQTKQWECWKVTCTRDSQETLIREYTVNLPTPHAWVPADIRPYSIFSNNRIHVANNVRDRVL